MSSITRAVTSRFIEFTNSRQRLTAEKESTPPPSTSGLNFFIPPEIIWEDYQATIQQNREPLKIDVLENDEDEKKNIEEKTIVSIKKTSPSSNFSQKMTAVVRKLSPFSDEVAISSKDGISTDNETGSRKPTKPFKETKQKMEKFKKSRRAKDRQQLIESESSEEEC